MNQSFTISTSTYMCVKTVLNTMENWKGLERQPKGVMALFFFFFSLAIDKIHMPQVVCQLICSILLTGKWLNGLLNCTSVQLFEMIFACFWYGAWITSARRFEMFTVYVRPKCHLSDNFFDWFFFSLLSISSRLLIANFWCNSVIFMRATFFIAECFCSFGHVFFAGI